MSPGSDQGVTHRFIHRRICGQGFTQARGPNFRAGQSLVATGTRVQVLRAVLDQEVVRPVSRPSPPTALHLGGEDVDHLDHTDCSGQQKQSRGRTETFKLKIGKLHELVFQK